MKTLTIQAENNDEIIQATEEVLRLLKQGYTSGIYPTWDITENKNKSIKIPLSENDLQELQSGEEFDWTFDGVDVHLYNEEQENLSDCCGDIITNDGLCSDCKEHA